VKHLFLWAVHCIGNRLAAPLIPSPNFFQILTVPETWNCFKLDKKKNSKSSPTTHLWRHREERRYRYYSFTVWALDGSEQSESLPGHALPLEEDPQYPLYRRPQSWSGHKKLQEKSSLPPLAIKPQSPGHPVCSQTLCWLSYPGSLELCNTELKIQYALRKNTQYILSLCSMFVIHICATEYCRIYPKGNYKWISILTDKVTCISTC
jgi:hypothetical protein